jgi:hypothetical protein
VYTGAAALGLSAVLAASAVALITLGFRLAFERRPATV